MDRQRRRAAREEEPTTRARCQGRPPATEDRGAEGQKKGMTGMMTRKNYRASAAVVREHLDDTRDVTARRAVASLARGLALEFKADNAHFRFDTFYAACGLNEWGHLPEPPALARLAEGMIE